MAMEVKCCMNCKHEAKELHEEPCVNCKNGMVHSSPKYANAPFLWEAAEGVEDFVNHPAHYETGKFECIDVMTEALGLENTKGFCLCNAFKYIYRCTKKHETPVEDVKKAVWYLNKFLELEGALDE